MMRRPRAALALLTVVVLGFGGGSGVPHGAYLVGGVDHGGVDRLERWTVDRKLDAVIRAHNWQFLGGGRTVLETRDGSFYRVSTKPGGGRTKLGADPRRADESAAVSTDGTLAVVTGSDCQLPKQVAVSARVVALHTGHVLRTVELPRRRHDWIETAAYGFSPDDRSAAVEVIYHSTECRATTETDRRFYIVQISTGRLTNLGESAGGGEYSVGPRFSPTGRYVAFPTPNGIVVRDLLNGGSHRVAPVGDTGEADLLWADANTLVHVWGSPIRATDARTWRTHVVARPDAKDASVFLLGVSRDGARVAYTAGYEPPWPVSISSVDGRGTPTTIPAPRFDAGYDIRLVFP